MTAVLLKIVFFYGRHNVNCCNHYLQLMKLAFLFILSIIITCSCFSQWTKNDFAPLLALEGKWIMPVKKGMLHEVWQMKNDSRLESKSYRVNGGDTIMLETVQLVLEKDAVYYMPTVPDQNEGKQVSFSLTKIDGNRFHFTNPEHDFPKRIIYYLKNEKELEVIIDDNVDGSAKRSVFSFKKEN